jgi:hypothetical protein
LRMFGQVHTLRRTKDPVFIHGMDGFHGLLTMYHILSRLPI